MLPEFWVALILVVPLLGMLFPSIDYWRAYRSEKSHQPKDDESRKADYNRLKFGVFVFGVFGMWAFWISGILLSFFNSYQSVFAGMLFTSRWDSYIQVLGLCIFLVGGFGYNWVLYGAGKYVQPAPSGALEDQQLITTGPFGFVRHPLYVSYVIILLGLLLTLLNYLVLVSLISALVGIKSMASAEETVLIKIFGERYLRYQDEVGMLFPKIKH